MLFFSFMSGRGITSQLNIKNQLLSSPEVKVRLLVKFLSKMLKCIFYGLWLLYIKK